MRLIDADEIREKAVPHAHDHRGYSADIRKWAVLVGDIDDAPTIEAEPVKHGRWIEQEAPSMDTYYDCSACGESFCFIEGSPKDNLYTYCPNCGAKMDGGEAE